MFIQSNSSPNRSWVSCLLQIQARFVFYKGYCIEKKMKPLNKVFYFFLKLPTVLYREAMNLIFSYNTDY